MKVLWQITGTFKDQKYEEYPREWTVAIYATQKSAQEHLRKLRRFFRGWSKLSRKQRNKRHFLVLEVLDVFCEFHPQRFVPRYSIEKVPLFRDFRDYGKQFAYHDLDTFLKNGDS